MSFGRGPVRQTRRSGVTAGIEVIMSDTSSHLRPNRPGKLLSVRLVRSSVTAYVQATGELDLDTVTDLERAACSGLHDNSFRLSGVLVLDLAGVTFCGVEGVNMMLRIRRLAAREGGRLVLCDPSATVLRVLDLTEAINAFDVRHTVHV
jgi:anti-anti-sigma factor